MNHLQTVELKHGDLTFTLKPTHLALYKALKEAGLGSKLGSLIEELETMNLEVIYLLFKHLSKSDKSIEELMEISIPLNKLATAVGNSLKCLVEESN